jgi:hypothetical protein
MTKDYQLIFDIATRVVAHPHTALTAHDKHRAFVLIRFLSPDDGLCEYIASQMTEDDFKTIEKIRESIK